MISWGKFGEFEPLAHEITRRFRRCNKFIKEIDRQHLLDAIATAGTQWGIPASPQEILEAIDIAGFKVVRKPRKRRPAYD